LPILLRRTTSGYFPFLITVLKIRQWVE